jgi:hypothetical protein
MPDVSSKKQKEGKERSIMSKRGSQKGMSPSRMIDERIKELGDWRGKMLSRLRTLIKQADPEYSASSVKYCSRRAQSSSAKVRSKSAAYASKRFTSVMRFLRRDPAKFYAA